MSFNFPLNILGDVKKNDLLSSVELRAWCNSHLMQVFFRELVSFIRSRVLAASLNPWHVTHSPPIG